jgi:hypothetical protein
MAKVRYLLAPAIFRTAAGTPSPNVNGRNNLGDTSFTIVTLDQPDTISSVMLYLYRSGSPGTIRIGIQGVTQSSNNQGYVNDGTFLAYVDLTGTAISTSPSLQLFNLSSSISLPAGVYSVVFQNYSGFFDGSNRCIVGIGMSVFATGYIGEICGDNTSATTLGGTVQGYGSMRGALRTYGYPYATFSGISVSTPNQIGNKIRLTAGSAGYYDVSGIVSRTISTGVGSSLKIYDDTLTEIGSISIPNNAGATQRVSEFYFTSPVRLYPDRDYYVVCAGTQQSNYYTLLTQSDNSAFTAHDFQYCNRATASGAFTLTSGRVAELGLIIEEQSPAYLPTERNASTITIAPGSTSQSIELYLGATGLTASTSGLSAYYNRTRTASVNIPLVARTIAQAWTSGGFAEVDSVYMPGVYRLDIPDAAIAGGADDVTVVVRGASGTNGAVMTIKLSSGGLTAAQTADAILNRKLDSTGDGTDTLNERTVRSALRAMRNKVVVSTGNMTVFKEDDTNTAWTGTLSSTADITVDPA